MATNLNDIKGKASGFKQPTLSAGAYPARVAQIIDLGYQLQPDYLGEPKDPAYELNVTYELLDEFCVDEEGTVQEDKPRWISEHFTLKNLKAEKAKSTLRYLVLDPKMEHKGEFLSLIGKPCMVNIIENPGKGKNAGKVFNNVASISPMRDKDAANAPALKNDPVVFSLDNPDLEVFNALPEFLKDKIKNGLEYQGSKLESALGSAPKEESKASSEPNKTKW